MPLPTIPGSMTAVLLTGHGGIEQLSYQDGVPVPVPAPDEVLIRVTGAGVNNTDINTRIGWYSKSVTQATDTGASEGFDAPVQDDGSWSGIPLVFPRIQGADVVGLVVAVGDKVDQSRIGERVLVRTMQQSHLTAEPFQTLTFGSEYDGGFAQYTTTRSSEAYAVDCDWSDAELASIPCAYSTAEGLLHRANVGAERVLITGASGGVGSAAIQLAKRRGAEIIGLASSSKHADVTGFGADRVLDRDADLVSLLGADSIDVVIDLVAGPNWPKLLEVLRPGGRYATAGAIAGPIVDLDVRTLYLKDLTFYGCTYQDPVVFSNVISYIEAGEIRPLVSKTYPLADIAQAQQDFLSKRYAGKLVLIPPA